VSNSGWGDPERDLPQRPFATYALAIGTFFAWGAGLPVLFLNLAYDCGSRQCVELREATLWQVGFLALFLLAVPPLALAAAGGWRLAAAAIAIMVIGMGWLALSAALRGNDESAPSILGLELPRAIPGLFLEIPALAVLLMGSLSVLLRSRGDAS
jgi:hypothetical protein